MGIAVVNPEVVADSLANPEILLEVCYNTSLYLSKVTTIP